MLSGKVDICRRNAPGIYVGVRLVIEPGVRLGSCLVGSGARLAGAVVAGICGGSYTEVTPMLLLNAV